MLSPVLTKIINASLTNGVILEQLNEAVVRPLLKKPSPDKDIMKNYRQVSNINHLSKVLEKVVAKRLTDHAVSQDLFDSFQSAYS